MIDPSIALMAYLGLPIFLYLVLSYYYPLWKKALGIGKEDDEMKRQKCIEPEPELCAKCPENGKTCGEQTAPQSKVKV